MQLLEQEVKTRGFTYKQVWRNKNFAIYEQWCDYEDGKGLQLIAFETFKIQKIKAGERFGTFYPDRENFPRNEDWGTYGFTARTLLEAKQILLLHFTDHVFNFAIVES